MSPWPEVFRRHRHDVLNGLQLVQGYLQLGKPERALTALQEVSQWLLGVSLVQTRMKDGDHPFLFAVATCPSLTVVCCDHLFPMDDRLCQELTSVWYKLEDALAASNIHRLHIHVQGDATESAFSTRVWLKVEEAPDIHPWLQTIRSMLQEFTRIDVGIRAQG